MKIDFFLGRHKLKMLLLYCKAALLGLSNPDNGNKQVLETSEFRNWFNLELYNNYSNLEEVDKLAEKNENFHIYAKKLINSKPKDIKRIKEHITIMQNMTDEMDILLTEIENKI